jgi:CheY-like chemotaxis protein
MNESSGLPPILLAEDNQVDIELTLNAFKKIQIVNPIEICRDGVEVTEKMDEWEKGHPKPVCVLLDLKMPRMNGLEVLAVLKEKYRSIPVIVLTTSKESTDVQEAYALGANSYIVKPVGFESFVQIARHINLYWVVLNSIPAG